MTRPIVSAEQIRKLEQQRTRWSGTDFSPVATGLSHLQCEMQVLSCERMYDTAIAEQCFWGPCLRRPALVSLPLPDLPEQNIPSMATVPCVPQGTARADIRTGRPALRAYAKGNERRGSLGQPPVLDFEEVTDIIRMVNDSDIIDFEIENDGVSLSIKKAEALEERVQVVHGAAAAPPPPAVSYVAPVAAPEAAPSSTATPPVSSAPPSKETEERALPDGVQIVSPMSGTFYAAPAPGEPAFAKEGDTVKAGQTVCIIEAMKLMNEIEAEISGEVIEVSVQNGASVTAGQALMVLKPL